jgi:nucleotide-binding universal stress UspA family protein
MWLGPATADAEVGVILQGSRGSHVMFKRILIATDGSRMSRKAIVSGVALAKSLGASVVGIHSLPPISRSHIYGDSIVTLPEEAYAKLEQDAAAVARKRLAQIGSEADKAGVPFKAIQVQNESPAEAILTTARKEKCDVIVMASHGRKGIARVLLGSETNTVVTHSPIPVLVVR